MLKIKDKTNTIKMRAIEIAIKYGVDPRTVYNWIKLGCPCSYEQKTPLGKPVARMNPEEVEAWIAARRAQKGIAPAAREGGEV